MATPALRAIRNEFRNAEIVAISKPGPAGLLNGSSFFDHWIIFQTKGARISGRKKLLNDLKAANLDSILLLTNSIGSAIVPWLARIPRRIGYNADARGMFLTDKVEVSRPRSANDFIPLIDSYLYLIRALGVYSDDRRMELEVCVGEQARVRGLLTSMNFVVNRPLVVINNSAASAASRIWPSQYLVHLCRQLVARLQAQVLIHCGPGDRAIANGICEQVRSPWVRSMGEWQDLPLATSIAVLSRADVVVSSDSGPRHIAAALNKPVVSLFGPTDPRGTQTFNVQEKILQSFIECRPCYQSECPLKHHHCMRNIEVDQVFAAISEAMLGQTSQRLAA